MLLVWFSGGLPRCFRVAYLRLRLVSLTPLSFCPECQLINFKSRKNSKPAKYATTIMSNSEQEESTVPRLNESSLDKANAAAARKIYYSRLRGDEIRLVYIHRDVDGTVQCSLIVTIDK
jgi:hypothetical protein